MMDTRDGRPGLVRFYTIGEATKRIGVGSSTLRDWERDGLIRAAERTPMGHRRYTEADIMRLVVFAEQRAKENLERVRAGIASTPPPNGNGPKGGRPRKGHGGEGKGSPAESEAGSGSGAAGEPASREQRPVTGTRRLEGEAAA